MVDIFAKPVTVKLLKVDNPLMPAIVPGDNVPLNTPPTIVPGTFKLVALIDNAVIVPVELSDPGTVRLPTNAFTVLNALELMFPFTVNALKLPRLVILFNAPALNVPLNVPPVIVPGTFKLPTSPFTVLIVFDVILPETVIALRFPNEVILEMILFNVPGDNNPLKVPPTIFPVTVRFCRPPRLDMFAFTALIVFVLTVPATARLVKVPTVVMFG